MVVNIEHISNLLRDDISIVQRGLLITILLLKDTKPEYTLAKLKQTIKMTEYNQDLIALHEAEYIVWSGYKSAVKKKESSVDNSDVEEVIGFMNNLYKRKFKAESKYTTKDLRARLKEHSIEDIKKVVANRYAEWKDDTLMSKHLNPTTIFRPSKFDKYLEEASRTNVGQSFVAAEQINLTQGDEIVFSMSNNILDKDVYSIKTYDVDPQGNKKTSGMPSKVYGSNLKKMLKAQNNKVQKGLSKDSVYIYQEQ
tara:strand:+ start:211 stop:969 length:759 start_codon:yes stop_codon:yes gene_type:complete